MIASASDDLLWALMSIIAVCVVVIGRTVILQRERLGRLEEWQRLTERRRNGN